MVTLSIVGFLCMKYWDKISIYCNCRKSKIVLTQAPQITIGSLS
jgi:hypothetical protein